METLKAQFDFPVVDLLLTRSAYGANIEFRRGKFQVQIQFPRQQNGGTLGGWRGDENDPDVAYVTTMRVAVVGEAAVGSRDFAVSADEDVFRLAGDFSNRALQVAQMVAAELLDWIRIKGQPWLCLHGDVPESNGRDLLVDVNTGERLPTGATRCIGIAISRDVTSAIDSDYLQSLSPLLGDECPNLPMPEMVLADALYLLQRQPPDTARAVLGAAMAYELKVKKVLRMGTAARLERVVRLPRGSRRRQDKSAVAGFDRKMVEAFGRSLMEDDLALYNHIDKLFEYRNGIAHQGESISEIDANTVVPAARRAFEWLDRVSGIRADANSTESSQESPSLENHS